MAVLSFGGSSSPASSSRSLVRFFSPASTDAYPSASATVRLMSRSLRQRSSSEILGCSISRAAATNYYPFHLIPRRSSVSAAPRHADQVRYNAVKKNRAAWRYDRFEAVVIGARIYRRYAENTSAGGMRERGERGVSIDSARARARLLIAVLPCISRSFVEIDRSDTICRGEFSLFG